MIDDLNILGTNNRPKNFVIVVVQHPAEANEVVNEEWNSVT